jgi:hypothetical protein
MEMEDHLVSYVSRSDVDLVLSRVPPQLRVRLRDVFLTQSVRGVRVLGHVRRRGRRDINLCSILPPRVSLSGFIVRGQSPSEFGAPLRGQWPPWAVRRYLLYDVLLHELGHLQLVRQTGRSWDRKYASEPLAQQFADDLRRQLWLEHFDHPDPIHNPPESDEMEMIAVWAALDKHRRYMLVCTALSAPYVQLPNINWLGNLSCGALSFVRRAICYNSWSNK